jgi:extradiol dioxygenase family protein
MTAQLNHTIVHARDKRESAFFMSEILGLADPEPFSHFLVVRAGNGVSLDFMETDQPIQPQHYAFLVTEDEFDQIFDRIKARGIKYWADPRRQRIGEFNTNDGGRGLYFADPANNHLEILTRPYGSGEKK